MHSSLFISTLASIVGLSLGAPLAPNATATPTLDPSSPCTSSPSAVVEPSKDCWYHPTNGWKSKAPGAVLKIRAAPGNVSSIPFFFGAAHKAWNVLYRTTDSNYEPSWTVTTIISPSVPKEHALISYQHFTDSAYIDASPSFQLYSDFQLQAIVGQILQRGWYVTIPDYEGPNASFGAGVMSGHATLDAVRATLAARKCTQMPNDTQYAMYGYSGGSFATEWAAELQVQYAHELHFAGAGIGGAFPNMTSTLSALKGDGNWISHLQNGIIGMSRQHPEALAVALSILNVPDQLSAETAIQTKTPAQMSDFITQLLDNKVVRKVLNTDAIMGYHGVPQMPFFIHRHQNDQLSPTSETTDLYNRYCGVGADIHYHINNITVVDSPHEYEPYGASLHLLDAFQQMFDKKWEEGCQTEVSEWKNPLPFGPIR